MRERQAIVNKVAVGAQALLVTFTQPIEQRLGLFQIERVEAFGEPAVDRSEQMAGFFPLP